MRLGLGVVFIAVLASCSSTSGGAGEPPIERVKGLFQRGAGGIDESATEELYQLGASSLEASIALIDDPAVGEAAYGYVVTCAALWNTAITSADDDARPPAERRARWERWLVAYRSSMRATRGFDCRPGMKDSLVPESSLPSPGKK